MISAMIRNYKAADGIGGMSADIIGGFLLPKALAHRRYSVFFSQ